MKNFYFFIFFIFGINLIVAQSIVSFDKLYLENDLIYEKSSNNPFTGRAAKIRKNGHIVFEDFIEEGRMQKTIYYYNKTTLPAIEFVYFKHSGKTKTEIKYGLKDPKIEYTHFNELGEKTLSEIYKNDVLIYRCEFLKNKKHGKQFCMNKEGTEITEEYKNGKRIK